MASSSVSFRISRSAEDLAETIHALSQRLVTLEQRLAAVEQQVTNQARLDPQEQGMLENVDRLLRDCRDLLACETVPAVAEFALEASGDADQPQDSNPAVAVPEPVAVTPSSPEAECAIDDVGMAA
ncbi:MAG: hypothetical protein VKK62_11145 [Synechococcaceae cyanobacterium]|nr:hypothetical protein [Synechococcaceae cyanobacterium]